MRCSIIACARNEGPFLVEWISHHLSLGFEKIFVATNDCQDGTELILDLISKVWPVFRIDNSEQIEGLTYQRSAVKRCLNHPEILDQDWVLHIDLDEYLNILDGPDSVSDLMENYKDFDAVQIEWRLFGNDGRKHWDGVSIVDSFLSCETQPIGTRAPKTIFRRLSFDDVAPHCPKMPTKPESDLKIVNTSKEMLDTSIAYSKKGTTLLRDDTQISWERCVINHYMHKSHDLTRFSYLLRGDANGRENRSSNKRKITGNLYAKFNRNETTDWSISSNRNDRIRIQNEIWETPGVLEAHYNSKKWFFDQLLRLDQTVS